MLHIIQKSDQMTKIMKLHRSLFGKSKDKVLQSWRYLLVQAALVRRYSHHMLRYVMLC